MIERRPNASMQLPVFAQTGGFVITIHRRTELDFQVVSGQVTNQACSKSSIHCRRMI
jgi:hypothetical protein